MSRQDAFYLFGFERDYYGAYTYYLISLKIPTSGVQCSIVVYGASIHKQFVYTIRR